MKSYYQHMEEISSEELLEGLLAYGMFAERIPEFLSSKSFFDFFVRSTEPFEKKGKDYIRYDSMRNINIPRAMAIPNPFAYAQLCDCLYLNWEKIKDHFKEKTEHQTYKVSRVHIRKLKISGQIFEMNYKHLDDDGNPEQTIIIKSKYRVIADISNCFPSIYSHSIPWALVGKEVAKSSSKTEWYNVLDCKLRNIKYKETNGLLIGPHTSNIFSEIILTSVDKELWDKGYRYERHIDDYTCYVDTFEKAESFILDLSSELKKYELTLNGKKTRIIPLPNLTDESWKHQLNNFYLGDKCGLVQLRSFLDLVIELTLEKGDSAIINYAMRIVASKSVEGKALDYYLDTIHHLLLLYPYLVHSIDECVFTAFETNPDYIKDITENLYEVGISKKLFEACSYAVFWAIKYDFILDKNLTSDSIESNDCIFMLLSFIHSKKKKDEKQIKSFKKKARELKGVDIDKNWLFIYETLPKSDLPGDYKIIKDKGISFIKDEYIF